MIPIKAHELIAVIAEQYDIPYDHAKTIILSYWRYLRKTMEEMAFPVVCVEGLGYMYISHNMLKREMSRDDKIREKREDSSRKRHIKVVQGKKGQTKDMTKKPMNIHKRTKLEEIVRLQLQEYDRKIASDKRKKEYKEKKRNNDSEGKNNTGQEELEADS